MKKTILSLLLLCLSLMAEVTNIEVTPKFIEENNIKIIDIRTQSEWEEMGIITNAHLLTFFDENNGFDSDIFFKNLNEFVDKDEQFAIISNTGSRSKLVSNFLGHRHNYNVINLIGGMSKLLKEGYEVELYKLELEDLKIESVEGNETIK